MSTPSWLHLLPALNATLNALSGLLALIGVLFIRQKKIFIHRGFMISACVVEAIFLSSYLFYHAHVGVTRFAGTGWSRPVYFTMLTSHTILAAILLPMAIISLWNGLKLRIRFHRKIARWTFPIWMYVSVTGVLVYFFLYQWFPSR